MRYSYFLTLNLIDYSEPTEISKIGLFAKIVNPFHATGLFRYPLKTSEKQRFSDVFRGYRKRPAAWNGLILCFWKLLILRRNQKGFLLSPVYKHLTGIKDLFKENMKKFTELLPKERLLRMNGKMMTLTFLYIKIWTIPFSILTH